MAMDQTETQLKNEQLYNDVVQRSYTDDASPKMHSLVITNCNGTGPFPFSRASIEYSTPRRSFPSVTWFGSGFVTLAHAFKGNNKFSGINTFENFQTTVLRETKHLNCLRTLLENESRSEAKIRNALALHYFKPLAYGSQCIVDRGSSAVCEKCNQSVCAGDTSLGNSRLWHGKADIVVRHSTVKITVEPPDEDGDDDDDLASGESAAKYRKSEATFSSTIEVNNVFARSQALAETIVNAFCEAKQNKALSKKFIPSFLATEQNITIILYNPELDILLLSDKFPIWNPIEFRKETATLNIDTLLQVWLALNFDQFEMEVKDKILNKSKRSNFKKVVGEDIYYIYLNEVSKPFEPFKVDGAKLPPEDGDDTLVCIAEVTDWYYKKVRR